MENNEIKEIKYKINKTNVNGNKHWNKFALPLMVALIAAIILLIVVLIVHLTEKNKLNPSNYITVSYSGANGYASAVCKVDHDKIYKALSGSQNDSEKLETYRRLADSFDACVEEQDISNRNKITVDVTYDKEAAASIGMEITRDSYQMKASGIGNGVKINLFQNVTIQFSGISPDAYATAENNWTDDYLSGLGFVVDKTSSIANGDTVIVTCNVDAKELARHGYVAETTSAAYMVDGLSSYVSNASQIDSRILDEMYTEVPKTIVSQTSDTTFRMLYKATFNSAYLHELNEETASDIKLMNVYFLKKKDVAGTIATDSQMADNYLYLTYRATISNEATTADIYFVFEYTNGYIMKDGGFNIDRENPESRYSCSDNLDKLYGDLVKSKENMYELSTLR